MSGGTAGTPKGVLGRHRNFVIAGLQLQAWIASTMLEWTDTEYEFVSDLPKTQVGKVLRRALKERELARVGS